MTDNSKENIEKKDVTKKTEPLKNQSDSDNKAEDVKLRKEDTKAVTDTPEKAKEEVNPATSEKEPTENPAAEEVSSDDKKSEKQQEKNVELKTEKPAKESTSSSSKEAEPKQSDSKDFTDELPQGKHDDFDWDLAGEESPYSKSEEEELDKFYGSSFNVITENQIINAKVVSITETDVVLDIGFKSDGLISLSEFRDMEDLKIGDEVEVYVAEKEDTKGQLVLSRKKAKLMKAWDNIVLAHEKDEIVTGIVVSKTKGGLIADVFGLETFLPGSQIDVKPIVDYDAFVGKKMEFKVVKVNETIKNAVVSHKALIESDLQEQRDQIISKLEKGQVLEGTIKNITDFGAFIDLGGVDGLLYITDISWGRINHPNEVLKLNQKLNVVVLDFDDEKKRISLGLKQLTSHPWDVLDENLKVGSRIKGKIVNIEDYGAFLEIQPGVEGLIHVSEVSWSNQLINPKEYFNLNEEYEAIVVTLDREERKMSLSIKQMTKDPWTDIMKTYSEGSQHKGIVKNITPFGVFVEFEEGIGGMVHISDLSWTKKFRHPNEFTKVGEELDLIVLEIDTESRKLTLGHKQIEENPWDTFEKTFPVGSVHKATILNMNDKGAIVLLPYGLEAFAPGKHLKKADGGMPHVDETLDFKVIEFKAENKKVIVSHARLHEDIEKEEKQEKIEKKKQKYQQTKKTRKDIKNVNLKVEKTTLGDIEALAGLKEQMEKAQDQPSEKTETKKAEEVKPKAKAKTNKDKEDTPAEKEESKKEEKKAKAKAKAKATPAAKAAKTTAAKEKKETAEKGAKKEEKQAKTKPAAAKTVKKSTTKKQPPKK